MDLDDPVPRPVPPGAAACGAAAPNTPTQWGGVGAGNAGVGGGAAAFGGGGAAAFGGGSRCRRRSDEGDEDEDEGGGEPAQRARGAHGAAPKFVAPEVTTWRLMNAQRSQNPLAPAVAHPTAADLAVAQAAAQEQQALEAAAAARGQTRLTQFFAGPAAGSGGGGASAGGAGGGPAGGSGGGAVGMEGADDDGDGDAMVE